MQSKIIKVFAFFVVTFLLFNCKDEPNFPVGNVQGVKPIYASASDMQISFTFLPAQQLINPGKMVRYGTYLIISEQRQGIHFFNNVDPANPKPLGFLQIAGNTDMAVRNDVLYADNGASLVAIDIKDLNHLKILSRANIWSLVVPNEGGTYFECIDTTKGPVIGWDETTLSNPKCYRSLNED
jgi:hypothetical protein